MTHQDCIAILLGSDADPPVRRDAEEHVARCSDCWMVLRLLHELAMRNAPADAERMDRLFGCGPVQDQMYLLAGSTADEIGRRHPDVARHVAWCHACRERLGEILIVERAAARGELGLPLVAKPGPTWREMPAAVRGIAHEVVGRLAVQVRRATAVFTAVPDGFLAFPTAVPVGALRGSGAGEPLADELGLFQHVRFTLVESELWADLRLQAEDRERVGMVVQVSSTTQPRLSLHLREVRPDGATLVARYTLRGGSPVTVKGLAAGEYLLEVEDREKARRFQVRFEIEASV